jgi:hypothetical protein
MKTCPKCGIEKPLDAEHYHRDSSKSSGFVSHCKVCKLKRLTEYHSRPEVKERTSEYRQNNKEAIAKRTAEYRSRPEVKEKLSSYGSKYRLDNKEKRDKYTAEYRSRPEVKERVAEWRLNNREEISAYNSEYNRERNREQVGCVYQIVNSVSNKIYIGQTTQGELRWKRHINALRGDYHTNHKLQADFNKFGEDAFEWSIIKEYPKDKDALLLEEAKAIIKYRKEGKDLYNLTLTIDQVQLLEENK